jgi:hypothetical protein
VNLSATYRPMAYLLHSAFRWVPGLISIQAIYAENGKVYHDDLEHRFALTADNLAHIKLRKLRDRKVRYSWVNDSFLVDESLLSGQLALESELSHRFLALFLVNPFDQLADVVVLEFPDQANPFKIKAGEIGLTTVEKDQIGAFLSTLFSAEYARILNENKLLADFSKGYSRLQSENIALRNELELLKKQLKDEFESLLETVCEKLEQAERLVFTVTSDAKNFLMSLKLSEESLFDILSKALQLERIAQFGSDCIHISSLYIQDVNNEGAERSGPLVTSKFDKVHLLLNKYEEAAKELMNSGDMVNGKNIAAQLHVTPPALSDAIRKASSKINQLLINYPDRWLIIRKHLKPIQRITESNRRSA